MKNIPRTGKIKKSTHENGTATRPYIFSQETIDSLTALGGVLDKIHKRMKSEGYDIINGQVVNMTTGEPYDSKRAKRTQ